MRSKAFIRLLAIVAVLGLLAAACSKKSNTSGGGGSAQKTVKIAHIGALSGDYKLLVIAGEQAAQLAFDQANAAGDLPVKVELVPEDTQGDPAQAPAVADKIVSDPAFVGVIGPAFSGESQAAGTKLDPAGIPFVTPSATNPPLADNGWTHWFRAVGNDNSQGPVGAAPGGLRATLGQGRRADGRPVRRPRPRSRRSIIHRGAGGGPGRVCRPADRRGRRCGPP